MLHSQIKQNLYIFVTLICVLAIGTSSCGKTALTKEGRNKSSASANQDPEDPKADPRFGDLTPADPSYPVPINGSNLTARIPVPRPRPIGDKGAVTFNALLKFPGFPEMDASSFGDLDMTWSFDKDPATLFQSCRPSDLKGPSITCILKSFDKASPLAMDFTVSVTGAVAPQEENGVRVPFKADQQVSWNFLVFSPTCPSGYFKVGSFPDGSAKCSSEKYFFLSVAAGGYGSAYGIVIPRSNEQERWVAAWGQKSQYMGTNSPNNSDKFGIVTTSLTAPTPLRDVQKVAAGWAFGCALVREPGASQNAVFCWGTRDHGETGENASTTADTLAAIKIEGIPGNPIDIVASGFSTCAITEVTGKNTHNKEAWCWGANKHYAIPRGASTVESNLLGTGSLSDTLKPTRVIITGTDEDIHSISLGHYNTCAVIGTTRAVKCWGYNYEVRGALPTGTLHSYLVANQILRDENLAPLTGVKSVHLSDGAYLDAYGFHLPAGSACALLEDKAVACWGDNTWAQVGRGKLTANSSPSLASMKYAAIVPNVDNIKKLAIGGFQSFLLQEPSTDSDGLSKSVIFGTGHGSFKTGSNKRVDDFVSIFDSSHFTKPTVCKTNLSSLEVVDIATGGFSSRTGTYYVTSDGQIYAHGSTKVFPIFGDISSRTFETYCPTLISPFTGL